MYNLFPEAWPAALWVSTLAVALMLLVAVYRRLAISLSHDVEEAVVDFAEAFPDRCMICSYHSFGRMNGLTRGPVEPHDCIEGNSGDAKPV